MFKARYNLIKSFNDSKHFIYIKLLEYFENINWLKRDVETKSKLLQVNQIWD